MENKIEKPWAVYSYGLWPSGVGLIVKDGGKRESLFIRYSGSKNCWDPNYVKKFETPEEAASYYLKRKGLYHKMNEFLFGLSKSFPEEFEEIRKERGASLCKVLSMHRDSLLAQSSPKCTTQEQRWREIEREEAEETR